VIKWFLQRNRIGDTAYSIPLTT